MLGIAAGAFGVSFAVPAAALKALTLEKPVITVGDVLTYADATTGPRADLYALDHRITVAGVKLPEAFASVQLIESIPAANLIRNVHHWAAHVMIATLVLHAFRVFFTGTYRKPRELTWVLGMVLLGLTLAAGFVGYALPWDAFSVTATGIGFGLARSIPVIGQLLADLFFGGAFPSLGSLPRLYTIHVVVIPLSILGVLSLHLLLVLKQKHSMPGYAKNSQSLGACWAFRCGRIMRCSQASSYFLCWASVS